MILRQITSRLGERNSAHLSVGDFQTGGLNQPRTVRPDKIFTASRALALYTAGQVKQAKLAQVVDQIVAILKPDPGQ